MRDRHPVFEVKPTRYGLLIGARRNADEARYYWRITQFLLPFYSMVPPRNETEDSVGAFYWGHAWVPIDDENCWAWSFSANPWRPYSDEEIEWRAGRNGFWGPLDEKYRPLANRDNDYLFDRERQRKDNYSGIESFGDQDSCSAGEHGPHCRQEPRVARPVRSRDRVVPPPDAGRAGKFREGPAAGRRACTAIGTACGRRPCC